MQLILLPQSTVFIILFCFDNSRIKHLKYYFQMNQGSIDHDQTKIR